MDCATDLQEKAFSFKVSMIRKVGPKIFRTMELLGSSSLYNFADTIVKSFNFVNDHSFGFYSNVKCRYDSQESYTLFFDEGMPEGTDKSVKNTSVCAVFKPKKQMLFLFDYGDEWDFLVECIAVGPKDSTKTYPRITGTKGEAPTQYEVFSGDDCSDDDLD